MGSWVIYMLTAWAIILWLVYWSITKLMKSEKESQGS
jgi:hypothetical protein